MRRKISKRLKRQCIKEGAVIIKEEFVREPCWRRKDCCFTAEVKFRGWTYFANGFDALEAYRCLLDDIRHWDEITTNIGKHEKTQ